MMRTQWQSWLATLIIVCFAIDFAQAAEPRDTTALVAIKRHEGNDPSRADAIAKGITLLDAEVIVFSEVRPHDIMDGLDDLGTTYKSEMPTMGQHKLGIAVLYKDDVDVDNVTLIPGSDRGDTSEYRKALAADVTIGNFDFKLIGLHLKSGRSDTSRGDRTKQAEVIADFIQTETVCAMFPTTCHWWLASMLSPPTTIEGDRNTAGQAQSRT